MKLVSTLEHYELLIDEGNDPVQDPPQLQAYMERWDGTSFFNSVLTFLHIEDKEKALSNIYLLLKNNGSFVLSVSKDNEWFECGDRKIKLYPIGLEEYIRLFKSVGFQIESIQETESKFATIIKGKK
ncbi:class I SAM-dependent methyltransferase [Paenibacillus sp. ACRRX]|uniref:class I SAM-dependent methyltransferase n=1 Tax=Paenibacillus sp. ACRRX TaxID=2918206 RepID=UPI001EF6C10E|nr:class I SAM-dependent methyltransferase [Paenibacillus sp. ACRRX]MCG7406553.1 class I SAM-dependent methyltransferase [Paenibacillus sp. ACRRX]